eukprot:GILJ01000542.1.p1 GENE.GILJ01000542.1~~GILJ01000542.1.p1  ORF type:complete len:214 (+),score=44.28 GILJ01000542.1:34-675(+)
MKSVVVALCVVLCAQVLASPVQLDVANIVQDSVDRITAALKSAASEPVRPTIPRQFKWKLSDGSTSKYMADIEVAWDRDNKRMAQRMKVLTFMDLGGVILDFQKKVSYFKNPANSCEVGTTEGQTFNDPSVVFETATASTEETVGTVRYAIWEVPNPTPAQEIRRVWATYDEGKIFKFEVSNNQFMFVEEFKAVTLTDADFAPSSSWGCEKQN